MELVLVPIDVNWGVGSKEWQMPPPIFFLPKKYFLPAEMKRGK